MSLATRTDASNVSLALDGGEPAVRRPSVVPNAWKSGIALATTAHLATVSPAVSCFELLLPELWESRLRKELVDDEILFTPEGMSLPQAPGLGVQVNRAALEEFEKAAQRLYSLTSTVPYKGEAIHEEQTAIN